MARCGWAKSSFPVGGSFLVRWLVSVDMDHGILSRMVGKDRDEGKSHVAVEQEERFGKRRFFEKYQ